MKIDRDTLKRIAHLARLDFDEKSEEDMIQSMNEILSWVEKLNELDTEGIEPITTMSFEKNALRNDEKVEHIDHERALYNAPKKDEDYFRVPKVLD